MIPINLYGEEVKSLAPYKQIMVTDDGMPFSMKGVTAFKLLNLFENGIHADFISTYNDSNFFRVFPYVPKKDWGSEAWDVPNNKTIADFIYTMETLGKYVYLTLLTDDDLNRIEWAKDLVDYLSRFNFKNLLLAAGNEPLTHKNINVDALLQVLFDSGYLYTSGVYEDTHKFYGLFGEDHSARNSEWPVKCHNMLECYNGGGPNSVDEPATHVPWNEGEPIKPNEALAFGDEESVMKDYYSYTASCTQFGFGGIFHCETAKYCRLPNSFELKCYQAFNIGLNIFPADTALGNYRRIDEQGNTLRTYVVGNTMVRHRPVNFNCPEQGWQSLDAYGIAWRR